MTHFLGPAPPPGRHGSRPSSRPGQPLFGPALWGLRSHHRGRAWPIEQKWGSWARSRDGTESWRSRQCPHTGAQGWSQDVGTEMGDEPVRAMCPTPGLPTSQAARSSPEALEVRPPVQPAAD